MIDLREGIIEHVKPEYQDIVIRDISMAKYCDEKFCERNSCIRNSFLVNACYDAIATYLECKGYLKEGKENE